MADYTSGGIFFSGIGNGTDFSGIVDKLKKVEEIPKTRLQIWKADWQKRYDAFGEILTAVQDAKSQLSGLNSPKKFLTKLASSTNESVIQAKASADAVDGEHNISVKQLASNAIWAFNGSYASKNTSVNTSGTEQSFTYTYKGKTQSISVPPNTTLDGLVSRVNSDAKNPGVRMSVIHNGNGYTFQVAGKDSGKDATLTVFPSGLDGFSNESVTWQSKTIDNPTQAFDTSGTPKSYKYTLYMDDGTGQNRPATPPREVTISGNQSLNELVDAINAQVGPGTASVSGKQLKLGGNVLGMQVAVDKHDGSGFSKPEDVAGMKMNSSTSFGLNAGTTGDTVLGTAGDPPLKYAFTLANGTAESVEIPAGGTMKDLAAAIGAKTGQYAAVVTDDGGANPRLVLRGVQNLVTGDDFPGTRTPSSDPSIDIIGGTTTWNSSTSPTTNIGLGKTSGGTIIEPSTVLSGGDYTVTLADGSTKKFTLDPGKTMQDLADKIYTETGVKATFKKDDGTGEYTMNMPGASNLTMTDGGVEKPISSNYSTTRTSSTTFGSADTVDPSAVPKNLTYTFTLKDGTTKTVTVDSGKSMVDVMNDFNQQLVADGKPAAASWKGAITDADGKRVQTNLTLDTSDPANPVWKKDDGTTYTGEVFLEMKDVKAATGRGLSGNITDSSVWSIQEAQNAIFTVDNWPNDVESSSNTVSDVIDGLTLTLRSTNKEGESTRISVASDTTSVKENIQTVLDAINSVLSKVQELTQFNEDKDVASSDPKDDNYSSSQWDQEKGSVLTGNYGVQLFKTRFAGAVTDKPSGFTNRTDPSDVLSGDFVAALSQMGIKMCTEQGDPNYGMFMIAPSSSNEQLQAQDQARFDDAIKNHLDDVINLFACDGVGSTNTGDFRYAGHVKGNTKAGSYKVEYDVADDGTITGVKINGVPAHGDSSMGAGWYSAGSDAGPAGGLSIQIDNLETGHHNGTVSIKQGKVGELEDFFSEELRYNKYDQENNGALMILQANYQDIMTNIQTKIDRETERISQWERRQRLEFSRLETLLGNYERKQGTLNSQVNEMNKS